MHVNQGKNKTAIFYCIKFIILPTNFSVGILIPPFVVGLVVTGRRVVLFFKVVGIFLVGSGVVLGGNVVVGFVVGFVVAFVLGFFVGAR